MVTSMKKLTSAFSSFRPKSQSVAARRPGTTDSVEDFVAGAEEAPQVRNSPLTSVESFLVSRTRSQERPLVRNLPVTSVEFFLKSRSFSQATDVSGEATPSTEPSTGDASFGGEAEPGEKGSLVCRAGGRFGDPEPGVATQRTEKEGCDVAVSEPAAAVCDDDASPGSQRSPDAKKSMRSSKRSVRQSIRSLRNTVGDAAKGYAGFRPSKSGESKSLLQNQEGKTGPPSGESDAPNSPKVAGSHSSMWTRPFLFAPSSGKKSDTPEIVADRSVEDLGFVHKGVPPEVGVFFVVPESWADKNGLHTGNWILAVNNRSILSLKTKDFNKYMSQRPLRLRIGDAPPAPVRAQIRAKSAGVCVNTWDSPSKRGVVVTSDVSTSLSPRSGQSSSLSPRQARARSRSNTRELLMKKNTFKYHEFSSTIVFDPGEEQDFVERGRSREALADERAYPDVQRVTVDNPSE
eukprot:TRINITY_DN20215_c0_g1_i2.p1 TRINITY_DN20215_c0_g1~~TRINITY_DN20215_c0_g1_i2.p1  ORF type:complete len:461 (+),score=70.46 TRINITY_DN20215_c0_g1_i2:114-1496(+)